MALAWVLWALLGSFGAHRFYLGRPRTAILQMALSVCLLGEIWAMFDGVLLPGMIRQRRQDLIEASRRRWAEDIYS